MTICRNQEAGMPLKFISGLTEIAMELIVTVNLLILNILFAKASFDFWLQQELRVSLCLSVRPSVRPAQFV